jgi:hypothetical protein
MTPGEITNLFVLMAVSGQPRLRGSELMEAVTGLQSQCIAKLIEDESGAELVAIRERLQGLHAHWAEFDLGENVWDR